MTGRVRRQGLWGRSLPGSGGAGADATLEDPLLRRRNFKSTTTVSPIHAKAAASISDTTCTVFMTGIPGGARNGSRGGPAC